jgi:hypothetical protein
VRFSIDLTDPRNGWIEVAVAIGEDSYGFSASDVLNDPIRELADLGLFLASSDHARVAVRFWLEPAGYELAVTRDRLTWSYAHNAGPNLVKPQVRQDLEIETPHAIAREILRCLRDVHPLLDTKNWRHPFPMETATRLAGVLAARA